MGEWEERYVRVIVEGGHREFFDRFLLAEGVRSLVIVSPWIDSVGEMADQFSAVARRIALDRIDTTVIVRHPRKEPTNYPAVTRFAAMPTVQLFFNNELHAKVYACYCQPYGFAYVGSANLTGRAIVAFEVGVMVDGRGAGIRVVDELAQVGTVDLLNRAGTFSEPVDKWEA